MDAATQRVLRPGRRVLIRYPGSDTWYERIALSIVTDFEWFVVQPDGRLLLVNLAAVAAVKLVPSGGGRPTGVRGAIESFVPAPTAAKRREWLEEGALRAEVELERRAKLPPSPAGSVPSPVLPTLSGGSWICCETSPLYEAGAILPTTTAFESVHVVEHRAFGRKSDTIILLEWVETAQLDTKVGHVQTIQRMRDDVETGAAEWGPLDLDATPKGNPPGDSPVAPDARCLDVKSKFGRRHRDWLDVAEDSTEIKMEDWPIEGPRSALWVTQFLADRGRGGPEIYHKHWRITAKLGPHDWGVSEHQQNLRFMHLAGTYDQLDMGNLAIVEAIARRVELIEYQYRERTRDGLRASGLGTGVSPHVAGSLALGGEEADLFDGLSKVAGGACVAPQIVEFVAGELEKTARIDKQARKAREEKAHIQAATGSKTSNSEGGEGGKGGKRK